MPLLIPAEADLAYDFFACAFAVAIVGVVLLTGWLTRTTAVVWVAILLLGLGTAVLGTWLAYRFDALDGPITLELTVLRLIGGAAAVLLVLAIWALFKLPRPVSSAPADSSQASQTLPVKEYDRAWLLSLLQQRVEGSMEKVAMSPSPEPADDESHPGEKNGNPLS